MKSFALVKIMLVNRKSTFLQCRSCLLSYPFDSESEAIYVLSRFLYSRSKRTITVLYKSVWSSRGTSWLLILISRKARSFSAFIIMLALRIWSGLPENFESLLIPRDSILSAKHKSCMTLYYISKIDQAKRYKMLWQYHWTYWCTRLAGGFTTRSPPEILLHGIAVKTILDASPCFYPISHRGSLEFSDRFFGSFIVLSQRATRVGR